MLSLSTWRILADWQTQAQLSSRFSHHMGHSNTLTYIGRKHTNIIQRYNYEYNTLTIPRDNTWIINWLLWISSMNTGDKTRFPSEFDIHLDIEYHVASYLLVSRKDLTIPNLFHCVGAFIKGNLQIIHLLLNGDFPKVSTRGLINIQGLFDLIGNYVSELMGFMPISCLEFGNDSISLTQYILSRPLERRLFLKLVSHCIFSQGHGI